MPGGPPPVIERKAPSEKMKFNVWFKAQFGRLPMTPKEYEADRDKANQAAMDAAVFSNRIKADDVLHAQYTAALYAWNAKGSAK